MRVTQNTTANLVLNNLQVIRERQEQLQQQSSTGVKISAPGDDPVNTQQILHLKSLTAAGEQYARNITNGTSLLTMADSAMAGMGDVLSRAKELAVAMSNDTNNANSRTAAVNELQQLKNQIITLGNTQLNGKYIFGGFKNDTPPFDAAGNFTGTNDDINIEIERGTFLPVNYAGDKLVNGGTPAGSSGTDIIKIFDNLVTALNAGSTSAVQAELPNLDSAMSQVLAARSDVGARMNRLDGSSQVNDNTKLSLTKILSNIQDVDYMQVISDLSKQQTAYQAAIAASAKISQVTLLDYLR